MSCVVLKTNSCVALMDMVIVTDQLREAFFCQE